MRRLLCVLILCGPAVLAAAAPEPPLPTRAPLVRVADLNVGEAHEVELTGGKKATVKLLDLQETRDELRGAGTQRPDFKDYGLHGATSQCRS